MCRREAGEREKKESGSGMMGRGKRDTSHPTPRTFYFSIIAIFIWIPSGSLCVGESQRPLFAFAINLNRVTHAEVSSVDHYLVFSTVTISCSKVGLSRMCLATFGVWSNVLSSLGLLFLLLLLLSSSLYAGTTEIVFAGQQTHCFQLETELPSKL